MISPVSKSITFQQQKGASKLISQPESGDRRGGDKCIIFYGRPRTVDVKDDSRGYIKQIEKEKDELLLDLSSNHMKNYRWSFFLYYIYINTYYDT